MLVSPAIDLERGVLNAQAWPEGWVIHLPYVHKDRLALESADRVWLIDDGVVLGHYHIDHVGLWRGELEIVVLHAQGVYN